MIKQFALSILIAAALVMAAQAQDLASITSEIDRLQANSQLDEETRATALTILADARQTAAAANERAEALRGFEATASSATTTVAQLRDELAELRRQAASAQPAQMADSELDVALEDLIAERAALTEALDTLRLRQSDLSARGEAIATELAQTRNDVATLQDAPPSLDANSDAIAAANMTLYSARLAERKAAIEDLTRERVTLGARQEVVGARISVTSARVEQLSDSIEQLQDQLANSRTVKASTWVNDAAAQLASIPANSPALAAFAKENLELAQTNLELVESHILVLDQINRLQQDLARISGSAQTVEQVLATGQLNEETANLLRNVLAGLPNTKALTQATVKSDQAAVALTLNLILWQDHLRNLSDTRKSIVTRLSEVTAADQSFDPGDVAETLIGQRREYLLALTTVAREHSDDIVAERAVRQRMLERTAALASLLDRRLLWMPTKSGFGAAFWKNIASNISWLGSVSGWRDTGHALLASIAAFRIGPMVLALLAVVLGLLAKVIRRHLRVLAERVGDVSKDTYFTTPAALALSLLHTLPWPLALAALAFAIDRGAATSFTSSIAQGMYATTAVAIVLGFFRTLARPNGVLHRHFGWSEVSQQKFRWHLNWFIVVETLVAFVFTAAIASGDPVVKYGIGRLAFIVSSIALGVFAFYFLKPHDGIAMSISPDRKFTGKVRFLLVVLVCAPLTIGVLPAVGFYDAAIELQSRVFQSGIVLMLAAVIYRLSMRLFMIGHRRVALKRAEEKRSRSLATREEVTESEQSGDAAPAIADDKELDLEVLSDQSRRTAFVISIVVLALGLWAIWNALLPALGIASDVVLWNGIRDVDGVAVSTGISLWDLTVALIFMVGGFVVARNVDGILELLVFERLTIDTGTRYAIITIGKYVLVSIGIVIGFSHLGLDWSRLQWVIAALGVGLGFGLQEIVANFVSGLIILFERPVRVGDIVTIGELEGTVTSIQIRATRITDFNNREVLLPNKSIITENVTNWTLNDQVTRIVLRIGVAYGSDVDRVREIILTAVSSHPDTLSTPTPAVFFMAHGDSSLDFEARVFVATPNKRLPVTHDLNRSINVALKKNDIEIPFPQRDLNFKTPIPANDG